MNSATSSDKVALALSAYFRRPPNFARTFANTSRSASQRTIRSRTVSGRPRRRRIEAASPAENSERITRDRPAICARTPAWILLKIRGTAISIVGWTSARSSSRRSMLSLKAVDAPALSMMWSSATWP